MNEIQNIHGKLLYLTQSLFQRSRITLPQKDFLKSFSFFPSPFTPFFNKYSENHLQRSKNLPILRPIPFE